MLGRGLAAALAVAVADQLGKLWVLAFFAAHPDERVVPVIPFMNLALTWNRGMSFGLFDTDARLNAVIFTVLAAVIVTGLVVWLRRVREGLLALAIGLIIGGALGNVADRLWRGAVVDFLDFHLGRWHFYVFNLADAAISVGVGLMVLDSLLARARASS
jgi:signal peptidase II